jgi:hypothetical protein
VDEFALRHGAGVVPAFVPAELARHGLTTLDFYDEVEQIRPRTLRSKDEPTESSWLAAGEPDFGRQWGRTERCANPPVAAESLRLD